MSKALYGEVNNVARRTIRMYAGVNGIARKVKKAYAGAENFIPRNLPDGYTQVKYIESTGTQYIDTGFQANQDTRIVVDAQVSVQPSTHAWLFGARNSGSSGAKSVLLYNGTEWKADYNSSGTRASFLKVKITDRLLIDFDKNQLTINEDTHTFTEVTYQCNYNLTLLAHNSGGTVGNQISAFMFSCLIYDNGTLIRDYVPCIDPNGSVGLYDMANDVFYGNAGTGVFTAGPTYAYVAHLFYSSEIIYTGAHTITDMAVDGVAYKLWTLTGSGTLIIDSNETVQYWMCGGGGSGAKAPNNGEGGSGGGGGYVNSGSVTANIYTVTIGAAGGATSISTIATAENGEAASTGGNSYGGSGGSGGGSSGASLAIDHAGAGAGVSTYPFGIKNLYAHCAGGGGGAHVGKSGTSSKGGNGGAGGTNGGAGNASTMSSSTTSATGGNGGTHGGGKGGQAQTNIGYAASAATFYGGGGGGGGNATLYGSPAPDEDGAWSRGEGGSGYQGVCYLLVPA